MTPWFHILVAGRSLLGVQLCVAGGLGTLLGYIGCSSGVARVPPAAAGAQNAFKSPGIRNLEIGVVYESQSALKFWV